MRHFGVAVTLKTLGHDVCVIRAQRRTPLRNLFSEYHVWCCKNTSTDGPRPFLKVDVPSRLIADMNMAAIPVFSLEKEAVVKEIQARNIDQTFLSVLSASDAYAWKRLDHTTYHCWVLDARDLILRQLYQ